MKTGKGILLLSVMAAVFLSSCSVNIDGNKLNIDGNLSYTEGTTLTREENLAQGAGGIKTLEIINSAGNITITRSTSSDVTVKITKKVKGTDENIKTETMENIKANMEKNGDKLTLSARSKEDSGSYIWDWVKRLNKAVNVSIDYEINVPEGVKVYSVDNNAGNTCLDSVAGQINVKQNAGDITLTGVSLEGKSSFNMDAGNINMDAAIDRADEIIVRATAGNVIIKIPEGSKFELDSSLTAGNLSGSFLDGTSIKSGSFKQKFSGGGARLKVTCTAGNVIIDGK